MPVGTRKEPFRLYHFLVEIDGITRAGFRECSGLDSTQDAIEYREGNEGLSSRKLPGMVKYSDITLKRGLKNGSIVLLDETGAEKLRWNFLNGWPTKWTGPSFNASGNEVAIETLEIAHEGVTKA